MAELRQLAERLGFAGATTYLASGNLLLRSDRDPGRLTAELEAALAEAFGFQVEVLVRSRAELRAVLDDLPFPAPDPTRAVVVFLRGEPADPGRLAALASPGERFAFVAGDLVLDLPDGQAASKLAAGLGRALAPAVVTARNLATVRTVAERLGD